MVRETLILKTTPIKTHFCFLYLMGFDITACEIRTFYCGKGALPRNKNYTRKGDSYECMKRGFGAGSWSEKKKHLPAKSLQRIKYVGPKFEKNFKNKKINNTDQLVSKLCNKTANQKKNFLEDIFTRANNTVDYRGYNNVLLFLHMADVGRLPKCVIVEE